MPVRSAELRNSKFGSKIDADVVRARIQAQRDSMIAQQTLTAQSAVDMENSVKIVLEEAGVSSIQIPFFLSMARQLEKLKRKYTSQDAGSTGGKEAILITAKWTARGLAGATVDAVSLNRGYVTDNTP